jgi:hypothetical protein
MKSQYTTAPTDYELKSVPHSVPLSIVFILSRALRHAERNEKARLRMARCVAFFSPEFVFIYTRKRAEVKNLPLDEQQRVAERNKLYQARYQERYATATAHLQNL